MNHPGEDRDTQERRLIYALVCQKVAAKDSLHSPYGCHMCTSQSSKRTELKRGYGRKHEVGEVGKGHISHIS